MKRNIIDSFDFWPSNCLYWYTTYSEMIDKLTFIDLDPDFPHEIV